MYHGNGIQWYIQVAWPSEANSKTPNSDRRLGTHRQLVFFDVQLIQKATPWTKFHTESEPGTVGTVSPIQNHEKLVGIDSNRYLIFCTIQHISIISMFKSVEPRAWQGRAPRVGVPRVARVARVASCCSRFWSCQISSQRLMPQLQLQTF
jgi:hypothetical protein